MNQPQYSRIMTVLCLSLLLFSLALPAAVHATPPLQSSQEEQQLHLELGQFYEEKGAYDDAKQHYEAALAGPNPELAEQAWEGLNRCLDKRDSLLQVWSDAYHGFSHWLVEQGTRLLALVVFVLAIYLCLLLIRNLRRSGYLVHPFEDLTGQELGPTMACSLTATLQGIALLHQKGTDDTLTLSENLDLPSFGTPDEIQTRSQFLSFVESVSVGNIELPLQGIASALQTWLHPPDHYVSGQVEPTDGGLSLTVHLSKSGDGRVTHVWRERGTGTDRAALISLHRRIAYRILFDTCCDSLRASSWQSLERLSYALEQMQAYANEPHDTTLLNNAADRLETALALDPDYVLAEYNLGVVYASLGRHTEARDTFKALSQKESKYRLAAAYNLGLAYYHIRQDWAFKLAREMFQQVLNALPSAPVDDGERQLRALAQCGLALFHAQMIERDIKDAQDGHWREAHTNIEAALSLAGSDADIQAFAYSARGLAALNYNHLDTALESFAESASLRPDYPSNYVHWAEALLQAGERDAAIACLRRAIRVRPQHQYAHYRLGLLLAEDEELDEAIAVLRKASDIAWAHCRLGQILAEQKGMLADALEAFHRATSLNKKLVQGWVNLAWYSLELDPASPETVRQAVNYARRALQLDEGTSQEWHRRTVLGRALMEDDKPELAHQELKRAVELDKTRSQSRYFLALLQFRIGDTQAARQTLIQLFRETERDMWHEKGHDLMRELNPKGND